jgi:hypothetical protein
MSPEVFLHRLKSSSAGLLSGLDVLKFFPDDEVPLRSVSTQQFMLRGDAIAVFLLFARHARVRHCQPPGSHRFLSELSFVHDSSLVSSTTY